MEGKACQKEIGSADKKGREGIGFQCPSAAHDIPRGNRKDGQNDDGHVFLAGLPDHSVDKKQGKATEDSHRQTDA